MADFLPDVFCGSGRALYHHHRRSDASACATRKAVRIIFVCMSGKERAEIKQAATETSVTVSRFMRVAALNKARKRKIRYAAPVLLPSLRYDDA